MEITMRLTRVVNGGHLVKPLDWLALQRRKVYRSKDPIELSSSSFGVLPQCHSLIHFSVLQ